MNKSIIESINTLNILMAKTEAHIAILHIVRFCCTFWMEILSQIIDWNLSGHHKKTYLKTFSDYAMEV